MAALWGFLGFFVLCATGSLSAALSLAQNQVAFQWPGQQSQPLSSLVKQPPSRANQPPVNQPPSWANQPPSRANQPPVNQPPSRANQPPVNQPPSRANQPPSWGIQPQVNQPPSRGIQPPVNQPPSRGIQPPVNQPPSWANQPPSWANQPPSRANQPPVNQPPSRVNQPQVNQPPSRGIQPPVNQPPSRGIQPPVNQPPSRGIQPPVNQPPSWANQPPSRVNQPPVNQPPSWANQPPSRVNQPPANQPTSQVKQPQSQTEPNQTCVVEDYEKVQCGEPSITPANCLAINCCFDGHQCYYGKTVTVQCTRDGQFVIVVARDITLPSLSLDSISLLGGRDPPCGPVGTTASFAIYQFPVTACGTTMMMDGDYLVYENKMTSSYEVGIGPLGSITRDSSYTLLFQCRYSGTGVEALVVAVNTVPPPPPVSAPGPLSAQLRLANGQCSTKGCVQDDQAYSSFYSNDEYPVTKVLREPVYVEVRILGRTDPNIVLKLEQCWATSNPDPLSLPQWHLLVNGCPYQDDRYLTNIIPVDGSSGLQFPTHHKRFTLKMFTFVDSTSMAPLFQSVFIHCSTSVCTPTAADSCVQSCNRRRRDAGTSEDAPHAVVSSGEICFRI
ncbi:zona pellucida glycoprotein 2, like 1 isoform X1 [Misgurnus anguillicaudatus]|uniref:zona pellucida glycoprotein 2, like 1 isoform X1 n=1 Tax=Misgurnus anguillicaudatus TaxID=75329 RepID=UPI003CCFB534